MTLDELQTQFPEYNTATPEQQKNIRNKLYNQGFLELPASQTSLPLDPAYASAPEETKKSIEKGLADDYLIEPVKKSFFQELRKDLLKPAFAAGVPKKPPSEWNVGDILSATIGTTFTLPYRGIAAAEALVLPGDPTEIALGKTSLAAEVTTKAAEKGLGEGAVILGTLAELPSIAYAGLAPMPGGSALARGMSTVAKTAVATAYKYTPTFARVGAIEIGLNTLLRRGFEGLAKVGEAEASRMYGPMAVEIAKDMTGQEIRENFYKQLTPIITKSAVKDLRETVVKDYYDMQRSIWGAVPPKTKPSLDYIDWGIRTGIDRIKNEKTIENIDRILPYATQQEVKTNLLILKSELETELKFNPLSIPKMYVDPKIPEINVPEVLKPVQLLLKDFQTHYNSSIGRMKDAPLTTKEISEADFKFLLDMETKNESALTPTTRNIFQRGTDDIIRTFGSPDFAMRKEPAALALYKIIITIDAFKRHFVETELKAFEQYTGISALKLKNTASGIKIGKAFEEMEKRGLTSDKLIPADIKATLSPTEIKAMEFIQDSGRRIGALVESRAPGSLPPDWHQRWYVHRLYDVKKIVKGLETEEVKITKMLENINLDGTVKDKLMERLGGIKRELLTWETTKGKTLLWKTFPRDTYASFLETRTLPEAAYEYDAVKSWMVNLQQGTNRAFVDPLLKDSSVLLNQIKDPKTQKYALWYLRDYIGMDKGRDILSSLSSTITHLEGVYALGGNVRTMFVNSTQHFNTVSEAGFLRTVKSAGNVAAETKEFVKAWTLSEHQSEFQSILNMYSGKLGRNELENTVYPLAIAEVGNRKVAFYAGYLQAMDEATLNTPIGRFVRDMIARGFSPEEAFAKYGDQILEKTQFLYGKIGLSQIARTAGGRPLFQFTSYSTKELELMAKWLKENPTKFFTYTFYAYGARTAARMLGFDIANSIGIGTKEEAIFQALIDLYVSDDVKKTKITIPEATFKMIKPIFEGRGLFPQSLFPAKTWLEGLTKGDETKLMPVFSKRVLGGAYALLEGQQNLPVINLVEDKEPTLIEKLLGSARIKREAYRLEMEKGYPVRAFPHPGFPPKAMTDKMKEEVKYPLTFPQLLSQMFFLRTDKEARRTETLTDMARTERAKRIWRQALEDAAKHGNDELVATAITQYALNGGDPGKVLQNLMEEGEIGSGLKERYTKFIVRKAIELELKQQKK